ncbi:MAG: RNA chaperone Hfq [Terracidiphilus sp.]|jgi:RNA chaperone Hfq
MPSVPGQAIPPTGGNQKTGPASSGQRPRAHRSSSAPSPFLFSARTIDEPVLSHQAELFYLQKQIQTQTPMVVVLEDGEHIEGCIEWYDRYSLKVRGRQKSLIYKAAIKYMFKFAENGQ